MWRPWYRTYVHVSALQRKRWTPIISARASERVGGATMVAVMGSISNTYFVPIKMGIQWVYDTSHTCPPPSHAHCTTTPTTPTTLTLVRFRKLQLPMATQRKTIRRSHAATRLSRARVCVASGCKKEEKRHIIIRIQMAHWQADRPTDRPGRLHVYRVHDLYKVEEKGSREREQRKAECRSVSFNDGLNLNLIVPYGVLNDSFDYYRNLWYYSAMPPSTCIPHVYMMCTCAHVLLSFVWHDTRHQFHTLLTKSTSHTCIILYHTLALSPYLLVYHFRVLLNHACVPLNYTVISSRPKRWWLRTPLPRAARPGGPHCIGSIPLVPSHLRSPRVTTNRYVISGMKRQSRCFVHGANMWIISNHIMSNHIMSSHIMSSHIYAFPLTSPYTSACHASAGIPFCYHLPTDPFNLIVLASLTKTH